MQKVSVVRFNFVTCMWGDDFVEFFIKCTLPSIRQDMIEGSTFYVHAPEKHLMRLRKQDYGCVAKFRDLIINDEKHYVAMRVHDEAIKCAFNDGAAFVPIPPDAVWSDGSFSFMRDVAESGKRGIAVCGVRALRDTFANAYKVGMNGRELFDLASQHFHPVTKATFWDSENFQPGGSHIYFDAPCGMIARCFHMHPIMLNPYSLAFESKGTVDDDMINCVDARDFYVVEDSDDMLVIEASDSSYPCRTIMRRASISRIAHWAQMRANPLHRKFFGHTIKFMARDGHWDNAEIQSHSVASQVLNLLEA